MALYLSDLLSVAGCQLAGIKIADSPLVKFFTVIFILFFFKFRSID